MFNKKSPIRKSDNGHDLLDELRAVVDDINLRAADRAAVVSERLAELRAEQAALDSVCVLTSKVL